jgi:hypothetical protein
MSEMPFRATRRFFSVVRGLKSINWSKYQKFRNTAQGKQWSLKAVWETLFFCFTMENYWFLTLDAGGRDITLAKVNSQEAVFGEVFLADSGPNSATVRADGESVLLMLSLEVLKTFFGGFADAQAVILRNIARVSAQRLRESNVLVASIASDSSSA